MKKKILTLFILLLSIASMQTTRAQDSSHLRISLLTCTPGEELYSIFGHSAIRIVDSSSVTDYVFNYGTFNFDDEGFYIKFMRGKLLYYVNAERFDNFVYNYQMDGRGIREQVLDFTPSEKTTIQRSLLENLKEENKYYQYDFFLDNCTTRLRDILLSYKQPRPQLPAAMPDNTTFRQAIYAYLDKGGKNWSKLGIDLLLGAKTDKVMTVSEQAFLPDNLMQSIDSCRNMQLVAQSKQLYWIENKKELTQWFTPLVFFTLLLLIIFITGLSTNEKVASVLFNFDRMLFFTTGLLGILLLLMWFGTDHSMTKNNFNLIWALPTHTIAAFLLNKKNKFVTFYFTGTAIAMGLLLISWFLIPQTLNIALIPFVILLLYRAALAATK
jgi:hypothetical protein